MHASTVTAGIAWRSDVFAMCRNIAASSTNTAGPAASDWDATRRTLTRRTHSFHRQYSLFGVRRDTDWRSVKEFHRLLTAAAFVTRPGATLADVARAVGYRSPASLCAAFAQLGLPSPGTLRSLSIAA
jgi:transcriptional regulator GlxA family with amidase domain